MAMLHNFSHRCSTTFALSISLQKSLHIQRRLPIQSYIRQNFQRSYLHGSFQGTILDAETSKSPNGEELITALNGRQDITVKVINCREAIQEMIMRGDLSSTSAKAVAEVGYILFVILNYKTNCYPYY